MPSSLMRACRPVLLLAGAALLSACAAWPWIDAQPPRTGVALSEPAAMGRPPWLQRLVAEMDAQSFPQAEGLRLKLSYQLAPRAPLTVGATVPGAAGG